MANYDLPKLFDEFVDARKNGFLAAKEFKENGGRLAGCLCSYTPQEVLDAGGIAAVSLCGTSKEPTALRSRKNVLTPIFLILSLVKPPVTERKRCMSF